MNPDVAALIGMVVGGSIAIAGFLVGYYISTKHYEQWIRNKMRQI